MAYELVCRVAIKDMQSALTVTRGWLSTAYNFFRSSIEQRIYVGLGILPACLHTLGICVIINFTQQSRKVNCHHIASWIACVSCILCCMYFFFAPDFHEVYYRIYPVFSPPAELNAVSFSLFWCRKMGFTGLHWFIVFWTFHIRSCSCSSCCFCFCYYCWWLL